MCRHFEYLILAIAMTSMLAAGQQRPQPPAGSASSRLQPRQQPLTDRDVIQMVKSGRPESNVAGNVILAFFSDPEKGAAPMPTNKPGLNIQTWNDHLILSRGEVGAGKVQSVAGLGTAGGRVCGGVASGLKG